MGCVAGSSCSSDSASNSDPEPGTLSRRRSPSTPPRIEDLAEALQLPRSRLSSNARYDNWVEQEAAYHQGECPEDAAGRRDNASEASDDLCDSQSCRVPARKRIPGTPRMSRPVEAHTRSCATASGGSDDDPSDPHKTEGPRHHPSRPCRKPRRQPRPEETSLVAWFEAQVALGLVTLFNLD